MLWGGIYTHIIYNRYLYNHGTSKQITLLLRGNNLLIIATRSAHSIYRERNRRWKAEDFDVKVDTGSNKCFYNSLQ